MMKRDARVILKDKSSNENKKPVKSRVAKDKSWERESIILSICNTRRIRKNVGRFDLSDIEDLIY